MNSSVHSHVLMCAPRYYAIHYEINPWMKLTNRVRSSEARTQWTALYRTLKRLGVVVTLIPQQKGCPDMVFTANAGVVSGKTFIPSHFRFKERQGETPAYRRFFTKHGYQVVDSVRDRFFEGEGDLLPFRNVLFGGYRFRSELSAHKKVSARLGKHLIALELINPHFYHLDTCFCPLDDETVLYYPGAFTRAGRRAIRRTVKNPIPVQKSDAYRFACNAFRVDHSIVLNTVSPALKKRLRGLGYRPVETPTSEFVKAGGSVKCLLLKL